MHEIHVPSDIQARYLPRAKGLTALFAGLVAVGTLAFVVLLATNADRAWQAYVSNWLFFTSVAQGGIIFAAVTLIVKARWNWSVRRLSLAAGGFLPISFLLLLPMLTLRENYFTWMRYMEFDPIVQLKAAYLNIPFLITRNFLGAIILFGLSLFFIYLALRPDLGPERERDENDDMGRRRWRERLTQGWRGQEAEESRSWEALKVLAPALVLVYALIMGIFSVDWAMSLEPHWFSTLLPAWFSMGAFWAGIGFTALLAIILKRGYAYFDEQMGPQQLHDMGKLFFAFSIFWMYLFWSQYIVIWYGKLPWEQEWIIHRSGAEWGPISLLVIVLCFFVPFAGLIGRKPKLIPNWFGGVVLLALLGLWLERFILIAPSLHEPGTATITLWEPLIALGFLGLFAGSTRWFLTTFPVIQLWQFRDEPEMLESETPPEHQVVA